MANNSLNASIYISKNLTSPLKQLEYYLKLLKEIHRYTEVSIINKTSLFFRFLIN